MFPMLGECMCGCTLSNFVALLLWSPYVVLCYLFFALAWRIHWNLSSRSGFNAIPPHVQEHAKTVDVKELVGSVQEFGADAETLALTTSRARHLKACIRSLQETLVREGKNTRTGREIHRRNVRYTLLFCEKALLASEPQQMWLAYHQTLETARREPRVHAKDGQQGIDAFSVEVFSDFFRDVDTTFTATITTEPLMVPSKSVTPVVQERAQPQIEHPQEKLLDAE